MKFAGPFLSLKSLRCSWKLVLIFAGFLSHPVSAQIIPSDRNFAWNPGMMSKGGIPDPLDGLRDAFAGNGTTDDSARIQTALDSCPAGQVVQLNAGTFVVNNLLLVHSSITLRGAGAGSTFLKKTNGARGRTTTVVSGTVAFSPRSIHRPIPTTPSRSSSSGLSLARTG